MYNSSKKMNINVDLFTANNCNQEYNQTNQNGIFGLPPSNQLTGSYSNNFACTEFEVY